MVRMTRTQKLAITAAVLVGISAGLGFFTFGYAKGASYLTNDPAACANCHVMSEHYSAWLKGSHRAVATCNDCHTPHNLVGKYTTKALNGFWHSFYFTTGNYPDPLRITPRKEVRQECDAAAAIIADCASGCHHEMRCLLVQRDVEPRLRPLDRGGPESGHVV